MQCNGMGYAWVTEMMNAVKRNGLRLGYRDDEYSVMEWVTPGLLRRWMQCNGMGYAWVTEDDNDECSVTELVTLGLPRMTHIK